VLLLVGSFLPLYLRASYGTYFSIALLAVGLLYLFGTEWDKVKGSTFAWPKRLIRLGMILAFSGGAVVFVNSILAGVIKTSPALYSTTTSAGIAIYLPGMLSVAAGFILEKACATG
jgi:hypothetical protein